MTDSACNDPAAKPGTHETVCRERIEKWHIALGDHVEKPGLLQLQALKAAIDAQLALEELRIKVRMANWPKTMVWGQLFSPALAAILGGLLGAIIGLLSR